MGNSLWEAKIYKNEELYTTLSVRNSTEINEIRRRLNIDNNFHFIMKDTIILDEDNFTAKDVYKNDSNGGYKIDLMSTDYFNSYQIGSVTLYKNDFVYASIKYEENMSLEDIKRLANFTENNMILRDDEQQIFFLNTKNVIIYCNTNFKAKDVVKFENGEKVIKLVTKNFYKKIQIIEHLKRLELSTNSIDWIKQDEFFILIKDFVGKEITEGIINEIFDKICKGEKLNDKDFIRRFLSLLLKREDSVSALQTDNTNYI